MHRRTALRQMGLGIVAAGTASVADFARVRAAWLQDLHVQRSAGFSPDVELALRAEPAEARILEGRSTRVWRYSGTVIKGPRDSLQPVPDSYLGPTLRFQRGQKVRIRFTNLLPEDTIVHWHGMDVPSAMDGHPHSAIGPGSEYVYEFEIRNRAGTYWYHPHPHERTGAQVYQGMAGMLCVTDSDESALALPAGDRDLMIVLQDRRFDSRNQLVYTGAGMSDQMRGFLGNEVLVNGRRSPEFQLAPRAYRMRILNGSNARIYKLEWSDGAPLTVIGTHGGLLDRPVAQRFLTLAPAQRADIILDLSSRSAGDSVQLRSAAYPAAEVDGVDGAMVMGRMGRMGRMGAGAAAQALPNGAPLALMTVRVVRGEPEPFEVPRQLATLGGAWERPPTLPPRRINITFRAGEWGLDGRTFEMLDTASDEIVPAGSSQIWEITNFSGMMGVPMAHPIHAHGRQFRVLSRQPAEAGADPSPSIREGLLDEGWTDTVLVLPGEVVRLQMHYTEYPGLYLYHCHILEHEDMGMMRNFRVTAR